MDAKRIQQIVCGVAAALIVGAAGCDNDRQLVRQLQERADALQVDLDRCTQQLSDRDAQIAALRRRLGNDPRLAGIRVEDLFTVDRIVLASRTGGVDLDGQPGDDGVVVYLQPVDADGDVIKAAGQITIQLVDLTNPGAARSIATYVFSDRDELRKNWYGGFMTNHYTLKCEFPPNTKPPREVQVRVTFLDWLTGREFVVSRSVTVDIVEGQNTLVPREARQQ